MSKIFGDNMMFQRDVPVKVWGKSAPNANVGVAFGKFRAGALADKQGNWVCYLPMMPANKEGNTLIVTENGKKEKTFKNILVGDIWLASGQSNMAMTVRELKDFRKIASKAKNPMLRYFGQSTNPISAKPEFDFLEGAKWFPCTPENVSYFSAVAYLFGDKLSKDLDVPIGILCAAKGGTQLACWIPENFASRDEYTKTYLEKFKKDLASYNKDAFEKRLAKRKSDIAAYEEKCQKAKAEKKPIPARHWTWSDPITEITPYLTFETPCYHYNAKVAPMVGFTLKGMIWYQGESNAYGDRLTRYDAQFENMVSAWRDLWGVPFHLIYVQLPSYEAGSKASWPQLRWYQYLATKKIPTADMINTIDCGEMRGIHPQDKEIIATRLEKMALYKVYIDRSVKQAVYPVFVRAMYRDDTVTVNFNLNRRKFAPKGEPRGFEILVGGKWVSAKPQLSRNSVIIKSSNGEKVEGVRYLWKNWARPDVWLFDSEGMPALSFIDELKK